MLTFIEHTHILLWSGSATALDDRREGHPHTAHVRFRYLACDRVATSLLTEAQASVCNKILYQTTIQRKVPSTSHTLAANPCCSRRQRTDIARTQNIPPTVNNLRIEQICKEVTQGTLRGAVPETAVLLCCHIRAILHSLHQ
jgi:hypothetical protein